MRRSGEAGPDRFVLIAKLRIVALAALLAIGLGSAVAVAAPFVVPNPYASGLDDTDISIRRLVVFGDSYSKLKRKSFHNWSEQLRYDLVNPGTGLTIVRALPAYAVSGATAGTQEGSTNDFAHQVTRWLGTAPKFIARDLTMVFLGYNDIRLSVEETSAKSAYPIELNRILNTGAAAGSRRIFLVMPHDWGRSPRYVANGQFELMRERTQAYNAFIADLAHQSSFTRLVAIDLFTTLECVFRRPGDFGLTNVTDVRPKSGDPAKYLFDLNDDLHFGQRGQALIRQVVQYYLTKGWDWANTEKNPANAQQKLVAELQAGKVFGFPCDPYAPVLVAGG